MKSKPQHGCTPRFKSHLIGHGYYSEADDAYHKKARERSEQIFQDTWNTNEAIRAATRVNNIPFTRIERAFMASAISETTEEEIQKDENKAKEAASILHTEMTNVDMLEQMRAQQAQITELTKELNDLRKDRQSSSVSVSSHHSDPDTTPPVIISTTLPSNPGEISHTMQAMLDKYDSLDEDSKNELFKYAISSGNENLQSRLLLLRQNKK
jgi:hypothetical protein